MAELEAERTDPECAIAVEARRSGQSRVLALARAAVLLICATGLVAPLALAQGSGAVNTVQRLHDELIGVMRNGETLGYVGRRDRLATVFRELFDLPYIARLLLGSEQWARLDAAQRARFEDMIFRYATGTFASRFTSYDGERFDVEFERPLQKTRIQVRGRFVMDDGDTVQLDYALHQRQRGWQILDVYYDGVSGTRIQRNEFVEVIENQGLEALFEQLAGKLEELDATIE
jgi:phospholipid transport system substrate-binding protein